MDRWKAEQGRGREKRKIRREKIRRERVRRKKMQMREKVGTLCFPMICGSGGSKSRLAKAAGAEPAGQMRDENLHAVVARSTFWSQNVQNTPFSDHFWKLRCWKSARRCGAKHILKSKCTNHTMLGPLLEVEISKKCTPLWREAHFEVNMYKTHHSRITFGSWDIEKVHAVGVRSTFWSQNVQNTPASDHSWKLRCRKSARPCGAKHISKSKCAKHHMFAPLLEVRMSFRVAGARDCGPCQKWAKREGFVAFSTTTTTTPHYTPIHCTTLQLQLHLDYILLHYSPLHYTALNYTQIHSITLHFTTLHYTTLHYTTLHYTTLHYITLHYTTFRYTTLHYTTLHYNYNYTKLHNTTLHYTTLHYIPLHSTTPHYITLNDTAPQIDR